MPLDRWRDAQMQAEALRTRDRGGPIWTSRGPENVPGRITDLAVDPGNDDIVHAGTAEGGVFRTFDGGACVRGVHDKELRAAGARTPPLVPEWVPR